MKTQLEIGDKILHESWYVGKIILTVSRVTKTLALANDRKFKRSLLNGIKETGGNGSNKYTLLN